LAGLCLALLPVAPRLIYETRVLLTRADGYFDIEPGIWRRDMARVWFHDDGPITFRHGVRPTLAGGVYGSVFHTTAELMDGPAKLLFTVDHPFKHPNPIVDACAAAPAAPGIAVVPVDLADPDCFRAAGLGHGNRVSLIVKDGDPLGVAMCRKHAGTGCRLVFQQDGLLVRANNFSLSQEDALPVYRHLSDLIRQSFRLES